MSAEPPSMEELVPITDDDEIDAALAVLDSTWFAELRLTSTRRSVMREAIAAWRAVRRRKYGDI